MEEPLFSPGPCTHHPTRGIQRELPSTSSSLNTVNSGNVSSRNDHLRRGQTVPASTTRPHCRSSIWSIDDVVLAPLSCAEARTTPARRRQVDLFPRSARSRTSIDYYFLNLQQTRHNAPATDEMTPLVSPSYTLPNQGTERLISCSYMDSEVRACRHGARTEIWSSSGLRSGYPLRRTCPRPVS